MRPKNVQCSKGGKMLFPGSSTLYIYMWHYVNTEYNV